MDCRTTPNPILPGAGVPRSVAGAHVRPSGQYDGLSTNSSEGERPESHMRQEATASRRILRCKHPLRLSTFNVRTLRASDIRSGNTALLKTDELCYKLKQIGGEITGLQETRLKHEKERRDVVNNYSMPFGYTMYTISAWENEVNAATGGLGIILGKTAHDLLISVERISNRIMKAKFQGNPAMSIIVAYAPTEAADDPTKDTYFNQLRSTIEGVPLHDFLAILTDGNARMGKGDVFFTHNATTNDNGRRHLEIMEDHQLIAANTQFQKRKGKLWTWRSPHDTLHQLDYILVRSKWRNSVTNCEAYSSFGSLFSDHRVVTADVSLSLRKSKPSDGTKITKYIWSDLATDKALQERYAVEVRNRYEVLLADAADNDHNIDNQDYDKFVQASADAAKECLRPTPKTRKAIKCLDPRVKAVREEVEEAYKVYLSAGKNQAAHDKYKEKKIHLYIYTTNTLSLIRRH